MIKMVMDILEKAKELLIRDKKLMPVLFVETEGEISIMGIIMSGNDNRKAMMIAGKKFAKENRQKKIVSLSFVGESRVSKIKDGNLIGKNEAILVAKLDIEKNRKEVIVQAFDISNGDIIWKGDPEILDDVRAFLLEAFVQGFETEKKLERKLK